MTSDNQPDTRRSDLEAWSYAALSSKGIENPGKIYPISDDASFRRYFRLEHGSGSLICVDAPPDKEDNESFVFIQGCLQQAGVKVPELIDHDLKQGFLLLSDFGDELLLSRLKQQSLEGQIQLYKLALQCLDTMAEADASALPVYDETKLTAEMMLFPEWFLAQQIKVPAYPHFDRVVALLVDNALGQPQKFVHRDYHARNLMLLEENQLGVIDFQDAVKGPLTYDLVSLLKDCYWRVPRNDVEMLVEQFRLRHQPQVAPETFLRWFDLLGFQRHLKCAGIFSRLNLRDGKPGYLGDIPLVIDYLVEVTDLYDDLRDMGAWLKQIVQPELLALRPELQE